MAKLQKEPPKLTKAEISLAILCVSTSSAWLDRNDLMFPYDDRFKKLMALQRKLAALRNYKRK